MRIKASSKFKTQSLKLQLKSQKLKNYNPNFPNVYEFTNNPNGVVYEL